MALMDLIKKYDDPYSFLAAALDAMIKGKLKLKTRGMTNSRELVHAWNAVKKKKIKLKEASDKAELYKLYTQAMNVMPHSPKQKEIVKKIEKLRKKLGI